MPVIEPNYLIKRIVFLIFFMVTMAGSNADPELQSLALVIAGNLQKHYGMDNVDIEVVAYGPGLGILTADGPNAKQVKSLLQHNVKFSACEGTLKFMETKNGKQQYLSRKRHLKKIS